MGSQKVDRTEWLTLSYLSTKLWRDVSTNEAQTSLSFYFLTSISSAPYPLISPKWEVYFQLQQATGARSSLGKIRSTYHRDWKVSGWCVAFVWGWTSECLRNSGGNRHILVPNCPFGHSTLTIPKALSPSTWVAAMKCTHWVFLLVTDLVGLSWKE